MNNLIHTFKKFKKALFSLAIFLFIVNLANAQTANTVNITVNIIPPYSPYYSDYSAQNASKVLLIVQNLSATTKTIKLTGQLTGDNGIKVSTKSNYVPLKPIILNPNETKQLNGLALTDIFDLNTLNVYGIDKSRLIYTSRLPEGNYTFCIQAVDMNTNQLISSNAPLGCTILTISYPDAPVLISPATNNSVSVSTPQSVVFNWINAGYVPAGTQYLIQVAEMPLTSADPNQVLNATSFPSILNKTIFGLAYVLSPSDPPLIPGKRYAWRVKAIDPTGKVIFKNDGNSGAAIFTYGKESVQQSPHDQKNANLIIVNPNSTNNQVTVTNQNPLSFNWILTTEGEIAQINSFNDALKKQADANRPPGFSSLPKNIQDQFNTERANFIRKNQKSLKVDTNLYKAYNIKRYNLVVSTKINGAFTTLFLTTLRETNGVILNNFKKSKKEALDLGFVDKKEYRLVLQGLDGEGKKVIESAIAPFTFNIGQDVEKKYYVQVKTQLRYKFPDQADDYAVAKTPVTIKIEASDKITAKKTYFEGSAETDELGNVKVNVALGESQIAKDLKATITIANAYYGAKQLKQISIPAFKSDTNYVNLGKQFADVYGYKLKLYVQKEFPTFKVGEQGKSWLAGESVQKEFAYDDQGNLVYQVQAKEYEAGVPIRLYRKGKQSYVPPGEGTVVKLGLIKKETDVLIATGKTQLEILNGITKSFVTFDKLLCNIYEGDEYYALAIDATNVLKTGNFGGVSKYVIFDASQATLGEGYTAQEKVIKFIPKTDIRYSEVVDTYTILSNKPPQSVVSGRISYQWKNAKDKVLRAYANQKFQIQVGYRFKSKSGEVTYVNPDQTKDSGEENYFVHDYDGKKQELVLLRDAGVIAGVGQTDETGRFTIQIDNLGPKGDVGSGSLSRTKDPLKNWQENKEQKPAKPSLEELFGLYGKGMEDPNWGQTMLDMSKTFTTLPVDVQSTVSSNQSLNSTISGHNLTESSLTSGQFEVTKIVTTVAGQKNLTKKLNVKKGGPFNPLENNFEAEDLGDGVLERVFIVVPINYHLYPAAEPLVVQPFEAKNGGEFTSNVWETKLTVLAQTNDAYKKPLKSMMVTIFRTKDQKFANMPLGEGDNLYSTGKLINPQTTLAYKVDVASGNIAEKGLYDQEFEKLWQGETKSDGTFEAPQLLGGTDYYLQVSSNPTNGNTTYKSYLQYVDRIYADESEIVVNLNSLPSRIAGRLVEAGTSRTIPYGVIIIDGNWQGTADKDGYFEILANKKGLKLPTKILEASANGYSPFKKQVVINNPYSEQFFENVPLQLGVLAEGRVADRDGMQYKSKQTNGIKYTVKAGYKGIESYIRRSNGAMEPTDANGNYAIRVKSVGQNQKLENLEIIPLDVAFFRDTIAAHPKRTMGNGIPSEDLVVARHHRMNFMIEKADGQDAGKVIEKVLVEVEDNKSLSDAKGKASFDFANASIDNYRVIVTGDKSENWIPQSFNISNPETKNPVYFSVKMKLGNAVTGKVMLDGNPVGNAKVYLDYKAGSTGDLQKSSALVATRSAPDGSYTLKGLPIDPHDAFLIATLDTTFTVIGDKKAALNEGFGATLQLKSNKAVPIVKSLFGFPMSVEGIKPGPNNKQFYITGIVNLDKGQTFFGLNEKDATVRVRDVLYTSNSGFMTPVGDNVAIEGVSNLIMKYMGRYNVLLADPTGIKELNISKDSYGNGQILAKAKIIDNSFNYPGSYLNFSSGQDFYLGEKNGQTINMNIAGTSAYYNDTSFPTAPKFPAYNIQKIFYLANASGEAVKFKFIEFDATANPLNSFIGGNGKIYLNVKLDCKNVPNAKPSNFTVDLKQVVIDDKKVYPGTGEPIELMLEKWKLVVNNWTFDPEKGGIISSNSTIKTSKIDIPIGLFNLRSDMMVFEKFDVNNFTLGGGAVKLSNIDAASANLIYDTKTGSDMSPHWRLSIAGTAAKPAAKIPSLSGLGNLDVSYVQVLSNDESILSLAPIVNPIKIFGNKIASFMPQSITNGADYFEVVGSLDLGAPRMAPFNLGMIYKKASQSFDVVETGFEGKGYVHFIADNSKINISADKVTIEGTVEEKPNPSFSAMPATFTAQDGSYKVDLPSNYALDLSGDGGQKFQIANGGMSVTNNDWGILSFTGKLLSKGGNIAENKMTFNVYGDVQVDGKEIKTGSKTPFGEFKMVYNFKNQELLGTLNIPEKDFGAYSLAGNVEMRIGKKGFYFLGSGKLNTAIPIVGGGYTVGFLITDYFDGAYAISPDTWKTLQAFQLNKNECFYENNSKDFKGFYLTAGRSLIDYQKDFDFVIVAGYVEAKAAAELSIWAKFGSDDSFGASIGATGRLRAGMSSITGTSMSGGFNAQAGITLGYYNKGFNIDANATASFDAHVSQSLLVTTIKVDKSVAARLHFGTSGYGLEFSTGEKFPDCPPK